MNANEADIELIERYINGKLTSAELVDFEIRLEEDREFARKFRLRKAFPSLFNAEGDDEIAQHVSEITGVKKTESNIHFFKNRRIFFGAIIVLVAGILICLLFITIFRSGKNSADQVSVTKPVEKAMNRKPFILNTTTAETKTAQPEISGTLMSEDNSLKPIELEAPADSMIFNRNGEILFRWKQKTDSFTNFYIISEISNLRVWWRGIRPGIRELKIPAINFKPGKFYWYVGTKEVKRTLVITE